MTLPVAMVAGEASGDLLASLVLEGLHERLPELQTYGIGGPKMIAQGFRADWPTEKLSVRGYVEVLSHYFEIASIRRRLKDTLLANRPLAFIGVDAPDFNLGLETGLRAAGILTVHFISPSIWAWRRERIERIKAAVDHMLVVFPFEEAIYRKAGIPVSYVGHPLADVIPDVADRAAARAALGIESQLPVVALLPGSRLSEIRYNAPAMLAAIALVSKALPELRVVVPLASPATSALFRSMLARKPIEGLVVVDGQSHTALAACDATLIASGTATLEAALFKRPMVIMYRMARLSWLLMRRMAYLPWVGLPNILAGELLVPEFLQDAATPEALAAALLVQLQDEANRSRLASRFALMHAELRRDTRRSAAAVIAGLIQARAARA